MSKSVAIIGGGVAGISAAVALAEAGLRVELFEKRPLLGGRASSYLDPATGERRDECQHGTMRCCTNLDALLTRLGVQDKIDYHDTIEFLDGAGRRSQIKNCGLPAPAHTALSFLAFKSLTLADKLGIGRAMLAMLRTRPDVSQDNESIADWFIRMRQTEGAIKRFWRPILVSACNEDLDRISVLYAFKIFRDGFLLHESAFHFGIPTVPLGSLYTEPTLAYLQKRGGCVRTKTIVETVHCARQTDATRITGLTLQDGERIEADYYVSALQCDLLLKLLPPEITEGVPYFQNLRQIELAPILGAHLWFDRLLDCPAALALLDRKIEWIFHKNKNFNLPPDAGSYLSIVISASHSLAGLPKEDVLEMVLHDVRECVPAAKKARLVKSNIIRWPKATISPKPGVESLRPVQTSPVANLFVAGEWTQTGWPSTMEGAARSGFLAAERVLEREGRAVSLLAPGLPPSPLARLLGKF